MGGPRTGYAARCLTRSTVASLAASLPGAMTQRLVDIRTPMSSWGGQGANPAENPAVGVKWFM